MNPGTPTFRACLEDMNRPAFSLVPVIQRRPLPAGARRLMPEYSRPQMTVIERVVAERYGVKVSELHSRSRVSNVAGPRQVCMYLARRLTALSLHEIGRWFNCDHSNVTHAWRTVKGYSEAYADVRTTLDSMAAQITASV